MINAPERIWVTGDGTNGSWTLTESRMKSHMPEGWQVPYTRADLAAPTHAQQLQQALAMPEIKALVDALKQGLQMGNEICRAVPPLKNDPFFAGANAALAAVGVKP
jgi:hypothetical protein